MNALRTSYLEISIMGVTAVINFSYMYLIDFSSAGSEGYLEVLEALKGFLEAFKRV